MCSTLSPIGSWRLQDSDLIISSDQPQEAAKGNDYFLPTVQLGRLRSVEITFLGQRVRTAQEQNLERTQGPLQGPPSRRLAEEESTGRAQAAAGACRLVYFGAEGHFITSWNHRMLKQMGPDRSSDSTPLFYEGGNWGQRYESPFSSLSFPCPTDIKWWGRDCQLFTQIPSSLYG